MVDSEQSREPFDDQPRRKPNEERAREPPAVFVHRASSGNYSTTVSFTRVPGVSPDEGVACGDEEGHV